VAGQAAGGIGADEDSTGTAVRTSRQKEGRGGRGFFTSHSYLDIPLIS
jgi:hypothetical protein